MTKYVVKYLIDTTVMVYGFCFNSKFAAEYFAKTFSEKGYKAWVEEF